MEQEGHSPTPDQDSSLRHQAGVGVKEKTGENLSPEEEEIVAKVSYISMAKAAEALSLMLKRKVECRKPSIRIDDWTKLSSKIDPACLVITVSYTEGFNWDNLLVIKDHDAAVVVDLMMGGSGKVVSDELDDLQMSGVGEAMNQMMGSAATAIADLFGKKLAISTPQVKKAELEKDGQHLLARYGSHQVVEVVVPFLITNGEPFRIELIEVIPVENAVEIVGAARSCGFAPPKTRTEVAPPEPRPKPKTIPEQKVAAGLVQFEPFEADEKNRPVEELNRLELIYDVPLTFTVELGRTEKTLKDVLELGPGSIVGLERPAGEPLDILVNGKLIAKGEVIVIDENYGIRIKEIISSDERYDGLKKYSS